MTILAIKHNNPGNVSLPIKGWTGGGTIVGASGQSGYASFPDMATGYAALQARIKDYIDVKGYSTISEIGKRYAEDLNWPNAVARLSGISKTEKLDTSNTAQMSALLGGIIRQETGKTASSLGIDTSGGLSAKGKADPGLKSAYDIPSGGDATVKANSSDLVEAVDTQTEQQGKGATVQAAAISDAGNAQASATVKATQASLETQQGWLSWAFGWLGDYFVRAAVIVLGLVLVAAALFMLAQKSETVQSLEKVAVTAVA